MTYDRVMARKGPQRDVWPGCGGQGRCRPCGRIHDFGPALGFRCVQNHQQGCPSPQPPADHDFNRAGNCRTCGVNRVLADHETKRQQASQARGVTMALLPADAWGEEIAASIAGLVQDGYVQIDQQGNVSLTDKGEQYARERLTIPER